MQTQEELNQASSAIFADLGKIEKRKQEIR